MEIRKAEKKALLAKLNTFIARKLRWMHDVEKWTYREIYETCGLAQNRLSEIVNYEKHGQGGLNESGLVLLLGGGIVSIDELLEKTDLTERERVWLETFLIYEDRKLRASILRCKKEGLDPAQILDEYVLNKDK